MARASVREDTEEKGALDKKYSKTGNTQLYIALSGGDRGK